MPHQTEQLCKRPHMPPRSSTWTCSLPSTAVGRLVVLVVLGGRVHGAWRALIGPRHNSSLVMVGLWVRVTGKQRQLGTEPPTGLKEAFVSLVSN